MTMKKVTMYSGDPCPYCKAAKALLKSKNVEIEEFDIWKDSAKAKEMLQRTNGARTIPQIFIGDHYVGGNDQLQAANRNGELDKLLTN
jgi:glutaredoxin 3|tara:strand:+ start:213 stop:476 length:264 start_codon:yes stop_codon:yes gene_type:complete